MKMSGRFVFWIDWSSSVCRPSLQSLAGRGRVRVERLGIVDRRLLVGGRGRRARLNVEQSAGDLRRGSMCGEDEKDRKREQGSGILTWKKDKGHSLALG